MMMMMMIRVSYSREEIRKRCNITRVEKDRNIDTKAHMVENLQGQSPTEQGCL